MSNHTNHPYHLVEKSPWPLLASLSTMLMTSGLVKWFQTMNMSLFLLGLMSTLLVSYQWWRDIIREGTMQGLHTKLVLMGLRYGMILFIVSEVLFFFSFFWAYFHSSLNVTSELGFSWPPQGIHAFNPYQIPLLNTLVLLGSGVTVTWSHHSLISNNHNQTKQGLVFTLLLGLFFTTLQAMEYLEASFTLADSIYGSTFFVATGFHGLHVIIGSLFLFICLIRINKGHFSSNHHMNFEAAIWYWHFVDVVWLFLYISIYWWGY